LRRYREICVRRNDAVATAVCLDGKRLGARGPLDESDRMPDAGVDHAHALFGELPAVDQEQYMNNKQAFEKLGELEAALQLEHQVEVERRQFELRESAEEAQLKERRDQLRAKITERQDPRRSSHHSGSSRMHGARNSL
jgi:hypothetical protein